MTQVFVEPIGVTVEVPESETLMDALARVGIDVPNVCAGRGTCGKCLIRLGAGELTPPTEVELRKVPEKLRDAGWRLACQARPASSRVSVEVRETSGRRRILTTSRLHHGRPHPAVTRVTAALDPPALGDARSDLERVQAVLHGVEVPYQALLEIPDVLRENGWRATFTRYGRRLIDVETPEAAGVAYGAAVDIGTSKIIAYLFDLVRGEQIDAEAVENPQMRYGEDVVSRIARATPEARPELAAAARAGINQCLGVLYARQGIAPRHLYDVTVVGNTAMHHLALGLPAQGLGAAPYAPAAAEAVTVRGADLGLDMNPEGGVHFPPPIAGFVGSDALAVIAATRLASKRRPSLAIDIGTNTEIALVHDGRVTVTSCASGPAFEGYQITHGMKAVAGAIEKVRIDHEGRPAHLATIGGGQPIGICGSGVVDLLAGLVRSGVVDPSGRMVSHPLVRKGENGSSEYVLTSGPVGEIVFTQHDVRNLQLAKGAIATGWSLLLQSLGIGVDDLCRVYVAGAFGNYLDLANAQAIDLLPPVPRERVVFVGNAAGVGAQMALIDVRARRRMARLRARITFLELAGNSDFQDAFAARLGFRDVG
ncbi:MAG TPA: ASKHA domain-containing protein [Thermoleophilia bacterium]|nr:ASKHA domain-containing protein [Thermoleophilia bacterium]HQG02767.1 ASKHA domain-containing protein [Thermoleophilia bacterium]HQG54158.1 ASKHA domain-containing protein [Thermoleophilia bacterium]HQJ97060.1 ASKHA domain-containing protein [Thermoleophilia bacterium]